MILAALEINWLSISIDLLLVIFVLICVVMTFLILMQRPKQEGLGAAFGGGVTDQVFGARTTNVLQRGTVYLGSLFFILAITLSILVTKQSKKKSLLDEQPQSSATELSKTPVSEVKSVESLKTELPVNKNTASTPPIEVKLDPENTVPPQAPAEPQQVMPSMDPSTPVTPQSGENTIDQAE